MSDHELKSWPNFFDDVRLCLKTFEIRKGDRPFKVGDRLILKEWDPERESYTGRVLVRKITYLSDLAVIGQPGVVAMSIQPEHEGFPHPLNEYHD
jgi:Domain of unknown function (DUF3850)